MNQYADPHPASAQKSVIIPDTLAKVGGEEDGMPYVPAEERRRQLVAAAAQVIANLGLEAATTRVIAAEAKVPYSTLHYAFKDKTELLRGVYQYLLEREAEMLARCVADGCGLEAGIRNLAIGCIDGYLQNIPMLVANYQIYFWSIAQSNCKELAPEAHSNYRRLFAETMKRATDGALSDEKAAAIAQFLVNALDGVLIQYLAHRDEATARESARVFAEAALQQFR